MHIKARKILLLFLFLSSCFIYSQDASDIMVSPDGDTITIKAISLAEIPNQVENTNTRIKKIEAQLIPGSDLAKFDSTFQVLIKEVEQRKAKFEEVDEFYSLINLENDVAEWNNLKNNLNSWKELINERILVIQKDLFDLQTMKMVWNKTIESNKDQGIPENVLTSEKDLLKKITAAEKKEQKAKTEALRKQNKITDLSVTIDEVLSNLETMQEELQSDFFRQDSPAIWQASDSTASISNIKKQILNTRDESIRNLNNFYDSNKKEINFHILLFILLWLGLYFLHSASKNMGDFHDVKDFDNARKMLSHYGLSAFILALFSSIWIYSSISNIIADIIQLSYLIIAIIAVPIFTDKRRKLVFYSLLILFFVHSLQDIFYGKLFFGRIIMFIEILFVGWIIYKIIDPNNKIKEQRFKIRWGVIFKILPIFYLFLVAAFLSNVFGYVNLAVLLENTVVRSLFNLVILILALLVLDWVTIVLLRTKFLQHSNIVKNNTAEIEKRLLQIFKIGGVFIWLRAVLRLLGLLNPLAEWFNEFIQESYKVGSTTINIGGILTFFLVVFATIIIFKMVKITLADEVFPRVKLPRGVPGSISMITGYFIAAYGIVIAISAAGVDLSQFGLVAGALGVGIGFGLQGIVANFIAGLVLAFERPIQVGDTIQLGQLFGDVTQIGVRSTTIRTYDGSEVIVPNSNLITNDVINWTLSDRKKRRDINVGVAYGSDPEKVMEIMKKVANEHPEVQKIPAPWALFDGFGDSALNFRIRIWTTMDNGMTTKSQVTVAIYHELQVAGIQIPFPQRDLYIKSLPGDPITKKTISKRTIKPRPKKTDHKEGIEGDDD